MKKQNKTQKTVPRHVSLHDFEVILTILTQHFLLPCHENVLAEELIFLKKVK